MAVLQTGQSFSSGDQVTATKLQDIANLATFRTGANQTADNSTIEVDGSGGYLKVKSAGISNNELATDSVITAKIQDGAVTAAKLDTGAVSVLMPTGTILTYAGTAAPTGYLLCDGSAISRTTNSDLFGLIGTTYGVGDGSTTFALPDLRGRVIAGQDDMGGSSANRLTDAQADQLGGTLGAEAHILLTAEIPSHTHFVAKNETVTESGSLSTTNYVADNATQTGSSFESYELRPSSSEADVGLSSSTGGGQAHNNVQPTIILNYIIKT